MNRTRSEHRVVVFLPKLKRVNKLQQFCIQKCSQETKPQSSSLHRRTNCNKSIIYCLRHFQYFCVSFLLCYIFSYVRHHRSVMITCKVPVWQLQNSWTTCCDEAAPAVCLRPPRVATIYLLKLLNIFQPSVF